MSKHRTNACNLKGVYRHKKAYINCDNRFYMHLLKSLGVVVMLVACSFFILQTPTTNAAGSIPPNSEITLLDQDYSAQATIPSNVVMGNNVDDFTTTTMTYDTTARAIEYKMVGQERGMVFVGIEPFINGNLSISLKVNSDNWNSNVYILGSTFWLNTQSLPNGGARVASFYHLTKNSFTESYYDVPASALSNGVNTINIMISGTTKTLRIFHDASNGMTTPMFEWSVQKLPYDAITLPVIRFENEKSSLATWVSTLLYGIKETVNGGLVSAIPGNDYVPFGIDYPQPTADVLGFNYLSAAKQKGVAWADAGWLPVNEEFIKQLLNAGWELGIHYNAGLNNLPLAQALSLMQSEYNQVAAAFGTPPRTWCSFQNADNVTHAIFAYQQLGMMWRNGFSGTEYLANVGNLEENRWIDYWSPISNGQMVYPSYTHKTDQSVPDMYSISYASFKTWVDNYQGKHIIGFYEYFQRVWNQLDTTINYLNYNPGQDLKFQVTCNAFDSRLLINFPTSGDLVVLKNGIPLTKNMDYSVVDSDHVVLYTESGATFEITPSGASGAPGAPQNLQATPGNSQVSLSWTQPSYSGSGTLAYHLFRDGALVWSGATFNRVDTGLINGQSYSYTVSASNDAGWGLNCTAVLATPRGPPGAPGGLTASPSDGLINLGWSAPLSNGGSVVTNYKIYRGTGSGSETLWTTVGNVLSYPNIGLTNGQVYYFKVSAVNAVGEGPQSNEASAIPVAVPSAPTLSSAVPGNAQVVLTWTTPNSNGGNVVTNYKVYRGTTAGGETLLTTVGNVLTYIDGTAANGVTYYYKVSAVNSIGEGPKSNEISATPATVPSAPALTSATAGNAQVVLVWTAPSSNGGGAITGYKVYRGTSSGGETQLATLGNVLTYTDTSLTNGQTYYYRTSATNSKGEGAQSNELSAMPKNVPTAPQGLIAASGNAQVSLSWSEPASNGGNLITGYEIYRGTISGGESLLATVGDVLAYSDSAVVNGQIYYYKVSAVNVVGEGAQSNEASSTPATIPMAPQSPAANPGDAQATLIWTAPSSNGGSSITGYKVYRSEVAGTETLLTTLGNVLTYINSGLTNGHTYYYKVSAVNSVGEGPLSNEVSATPATVPNAPTLTSAIPGNAQVVLTWTTPSSNGGNAIMNYKVYRGSSAGAETLLTTLGNVLTYTNTGLTNGQAYYYKVTATNSIGEGAQSNELSALPVSVPSAPTLTSSTPGNAQMTLAWTVPSSNGGSAITNYKVYRGSTSGGETILTTLGNVLTYTDTSLTNGQSYYYKVSAVNSVGEGPLSNELSGMPTNTPLYDYLVSSNLVKDSSGATVYTGSDMSAALNWAVSHSNKLTYVPTGTYTLTNRVNAFASGVTLYGDGPKKTIFDFVWDHTGRTDTQFSANWYFGIQPSNVNNVVLKQFGITGDGCIIFDTTTGTTSNNLVQDVTIRNTSNVQYFAGFGSIISNGCTADRYKFVRCVADHTGSSGFALIGRAAEADVMALSGTYTNLAFEQCNATYCGKTERFSEEVDGFAVGQGCRVMGISFMGCEADYNWESGFDLVGYGNYPTYNIMSAVLSSCIANNNGQANSDPRGPIYGYGVMQGIYATLMNFIATGNPGAMNGGVQGWQSRYDSSVDPTYTYYVGIYGGATNMVYNSAGALQYTGTNFTTALQWACSHANALVFVPRGADLDLYTAQAYSVTASISLANGVTLYGQPFRGYWPSAYTAVQFVNPGNSFVLGNGAKITNIQLIKGGQQVPMILQDSPSDGNPALTPSFALAAGNEQAITIAEIRNRPKG
jgi:fibronectin type 3 domain-containing protein